MITRADRIRLAVALTALRFKLGSQSIAACVFDLRIAFPVPSYISSREQVWRSRLCELERRISQLEAELDAERIRSLALAGNHGDDNSVSTETSFALSTNAREKKSRKKSTIVKDKEAEKCYCLDLKALQNRAPPPLSTVFAAIDAFSQLVSLDTRSGLEQDTVTSATLRSVEAIADSLHSLLLSKSTQREHKQHLDTLNSLLQYVLAHGIPLLYPFSKAHGHKRKRDAGDEQYQGEPIHCLLELTRGRIFIPAIAGICQLSDSYLSRLLCPKTGTNLNTDNVSKVEVFHFQDAPADLRRCILLFLQDNLHLLFSCISSAVTGNNSNRKAMLFNFQTSLILATIQGLDTAVFNQSSESVLAQTFSFHPQCQDNYFSRSRMTGDGSTIDCISNAGIGFKAKNDIGVSDLHKRVKRLATKDSVWYLCNIFHILLDGVCLANKDDVGLFQNDGVGHGEERGINGNTQGINSQRAGLILSKATDDALFSFMSKYQQIMECKGVSSSNHDCLDYSSTNIKAPLGPFEVDDGQLTGSEATLHMNSLVQGGGQGDRARERGAIDSVTYDMILAVVERFLLSFPRWQS